MDENEQLQAYLEGELSESEVAAFEQLIAEDPDLAERVRLHRRLESAFGDPTELALEEELRAIMEEEGDKGEENDELGRIEPLRNKRGKSYRTYLLVAASIALIAVVGFLLTDSGPGIPPGELFAAHYSTYDASKELRTDGEIPKDLLDPAFDHYIAKDYPAAQKDFSDILGLFPGHPRATFYLGLCQVENQELEEARKSFQAVIDHKQNLYMTQSAWYLGLVCLKLDDQGCVREHLEPLAERDNLYKEGAEEILDELN